MPIKREQLKFNLLRIKEEKYQVNKDEIPYEYIESMFDFIGDVDYELRDDLIYETLYYWILKYKYFNESKLKEMLLILIDEQHLFYKIGKSDCDSVFTRSFSVLALSLVLTYQKEKPFLDRETFINVKDALIKFYKTERDFRGYVLGKGWAHSIAHGADAFNELVQCKESDAMIHKEVLDVIEKVLFNGSYCLCHKEDDRLANTVYSIYIANYLSNEQLMRWFNKLSGNCSFKDGQDIYLSSINFRNLIRSMYFKLRHFKCDVKTLDLVLNIEKRMNSSVY